MIARINTQQPQLNMSAAKAFKVAEESEQKFLEKTSNVYLNAIQQGKDQHGTPDRIPSMEELARAVNEIAKDLDLMQTKIAVRFDKESNTGVMEVINRETGEVIKQMPPEEILKIKKVFHSLITGFLLDEKV